MSVTSPVLRRAGSEHPLFVAGALVVALLVFAGFARTFYLQGVFGSPPLSGLLLAHGVAMTAWIVLFIGQVGLVGAGRTDLHRRLGLAGGAIAVLIVVLNVTTVIEAGRRGFTPRPDISPLAFMAIPLADVVVFVSLVGVALWQRRRPATHKRLMLLATLGILTPAIARLPVETLREGGLPAFFAVTIVCVVVAVAYDTWRHRRLHPAFGWGGAFLIASVPARIATAQTDAWQGFARWLVT